MLIPLPTPPIIYVVKLAIGTTIYVLLVLATSALGYEPQPLPFALAWIGGITFSCIMSGIDRIA